MPEVRAGRSGILSTGLADIVLVGISAVSGILTARLLGPTGRGEFAIVVLWPGLIAAVGSLGVKEALTYQQALGRQAGSQLVGISLLLATVQTLLLVFIGWLVLPWLLSAQNPEVVRSGFAYLAFIPLNLYSLYALSLLHGNLDMLTYNLLRVSVSAVYLLLVCLCWLLGIAAVWTLTLSLLAANLTVAVVSVVVVIAKFGLRLTLDIPLIRAILSYGTRSHVGTLSYMLNQRADQILMALVLPPRELGWYVVAANVSGLTRIAAGAFSTLVFPRAARAISDERRGVVALYSRLTVTATLALAGVLMATIPFLLPLVYGQDFAPSIVPAMILTVATVFVAVGQTWAGSFRGIGRPSVPAMAELVSLILTVAALALLLPSLGIVGAALASLLAYSASSLFLYLQLQREWAFNWLEVLKPVPPHDLLIMIAR
jgi:O-antigen/teichoic acid export membrane protein